MLASGAGLLVAGAWSLGRALDDAEAQAVRDARRAAEATARDLRRAIRDPHALEHAAPDHRFELKNGHIVVPDDVAPLDPPAEDPRAALPGFVRATLDELDSDPTAPARVLAAASGLDERSRDWLELRVAWHAHRAGDPAELDSLLDGIDTRRSADHAPPPYRATTLGALLLAAAAGRALPPWALALAPRLGDEETLGLVERLRERKLFDVASSIERAHADVAARRGSLRTAEHVGSVLADAAAPIVLPVGELLVLYRPTSPGTGDGAVVAPHAFADRLRAAGDALVVPWSGHLRDASAAGADAFEVVPGLLALDPDTPRVDRSGLVGFALVLAACAAVFVGGLIAMRRALRRETEALRARAEFLTSVTHELKTPLASIRLLAERLREGRVRGVEKQQEYYALLAGESARLTVLIENVLDLGRMERGERSHDPRPESVDAVAREAAALFEPIARSDGLEFRFVADSGDARAAIDRGAVVQALVNLLDNARKYGRTGGVIELSTAVRGDACEIAVRDHGPGVPVAERAQIFERFARGSAHKDGAVPGVGLGLHLARTIARAHGGELVCTTPDDGAGARFALRLPQLRGADASQGDPAREGAR